MVDGVIVIVWLYPCMKYLSLMQDERKLKPEQNKFVQASNKQLTLTFVLF